MIVYHGSIEEIKQPDIQYSKNYLEYDIIIGHVADDDVFKTVDMYFRGLWDKKRTIQELRYYKKNNQIAIVNQKVLENVLRFEKSYQVRVSDNG